jgi:hypothetical protein
VLQPKDGSMQFEEILLTGRVIAVSVISCFAIGLPVVLAGFSFCNKRPNAEGCWLYAPLVGAGFVILVGQNLLYADVPTSKSAVLIWLLAAAGWVWLLTSSSRRSLLRPVPWVALGLGVAAYLVHAGGLLSLGASNYYGYGWTDMFNYVSMAQFFADIPFHSDISGQGYLRAAQSFKIDRIGQSVLHSFLMVSSGTDAQQSFGTTILLSPYLMFFAFLTIARRFVGPSPIAYLASIAGSVSPAVATIHLECYFSQSMCLPFLLLWPAAISYLVDAPGWRSALLAGLLMSVISAVYTEFIPILLAIAIVCGLARDTLGVKILRSRFPWKLPADKPAGRPFGSTLLWLPVVVVVAVVANPGYAQVARSIFFRKATETVLAQLYPWAFEFEGLARLWLGNQVQRPPETIFEIIVGVMVLIFFCNMISLTVYARRAFSAFFLAFVLLMFIPLGPLVIGGSRYPYQFYKLLLTVTPLHAFWFVTGVTMLRGYSVVHRNYAYAFGAAVAVVNGFLTFSITRASAETSTTVISHRGGAHVLIDADFSRLRTYLGPIKDRDILTLWYDNELFQGAYRSAWIDYFARRNRVRSLISTAGVNADATAAPVDQRLSPQSLLQVSSAIVVTWKPIDDLKDRLVMANPLVSVYETSSQEEMRRLIDASRITLLRKLKLDATQDFDPASWYPVWVAGKPGYATLLTMKFGKFNEFRYDQWGYQPVHLTPHGNCGGKAMTLTVRLMEIDKHLVLECNGAAVEADLAVPYSSLENRGPAHFGWNAGITSLGSEYPLGENFPGSVVEIP